MGDSNGRALIPASEKNFWALGKMMGVPAEVMKRVAALGHVEANSTVLPKFAERRSTPTTVRASGFERSRVGKSLH